ncbi:MAG: cache domain-containing protein [Lentisphaerota bacterium]
MISDKPRRTRHRFGLAPKLILLVVLATLIVGTVVGALVLVKSRDALRDHIFDSSLKAADLAAQFAAQYIDLAQAAARDLAMRPLIVQAAATGSFEKAGPELVRFLQLNPRFDGVTILDTHGIMRVTGVVNAAHLGQSSADRDWFQQVTATGKPYLGAPVLSRATGRPNIHYGVPILDERGNLRGGLVTGISLAALTEAILKMQVGTGARAALIDFRRQGILLAHADPKRVLQPISGKNESTRRLMDGERGTLETINSTGERVLNAFAPVPGVPWGILITQPSQTAFAALDALTRQTLLLGALALLITALTGGWLARRITRPILTLRDAAHALAAGDLSHRVQFSRKDEIGELAQVFNGMAEALQAEQTALRRRAENFFNLSLDMLCVAGFDGYFKTLNPAWERTLGFSTEELQGPSLISSIPTTARPRAKRRRN